MNGIGRHGDHLERDYCGVGRVILPPGVDREDYVKNCYQTSTVSIINRTHLDVMHEVDIDSEILSRVEFPSSKEVLGSSVVWLTIPIYNRPVIVALLNQKGQMTHLVEGSFNIVREVSDGMVSLVGRAKEGRITINALSNKNSGGKINITVGNKAGTGEVLLSIDGSLTVNSKTTTFTSTGNTRLNSYSTTTKKSSFIEIQNSQVESRVEEGTSGYKFDKSSMEIGDGSDKAVLATKLESFLHKFIDTVSQSTVATSLGTMPLLNAAQIQALKTETSQWISEYLKVQ